MKKGMEITGVIDHIEFPEKGILLTEEGEVVVKGTITGQTVSCRLKKKRNGRWEAMLLEILEPSALETEPARCRNFRCGIGGCGGCAYQTFDYGEQLLMKETQIRKMIDTAWHEPYTFEGISAVQEDDGTYRRFAYRNKMEYSFGDAYKGGPLSLGLHKKGGFYDILLADDCAIVHADMNRVVSCVCRYCTELGLSFYHKMSHQGYLRHLLVRRSEKTGDLLVGLVTSSDYACETMQEEEMLAGFAESLLAIPLDGRIRGILHVINDRESDDIIPERVDLLWGEDYIEEEILGLTFKITPFSFFQTNSRGAELLYGKVREYLKESIEGEPVIYDLYSGTGTIGQIVAPVAKEVVGVEIVEEAVTAANENAAINGLKNARFLAGDVFKVLDSATGEELPKPDFIILDPPRDGLSPKALKKVLSYDVPGIIYVACKPTSLVRDLPAFAEAGYHLKKVCLAELFPNTPHVEVAALLERVSNRKADSYVKLNVKMEDYYRIKDSTGTGKCGGVTEDE